MEVEIQLKLKVNNFLEVKEKIDSLAKFISQENKIDYYFRGNFKFARTELRLRKIGKENASGYFSGLDS